MRSTALALTLAALVLAPAARGFDLFWTDQFGESIYGLAGPDTVEVGDTLRVALTGADPLYPEDMVAGPWQFWVDGVQQAGGFSIWLTGGVWSTELEFVYDTAGAHALSFRAQDHGHGGGMMNWQWFQIDAVTQVTEPEPPSSVPEDGPASAGPSWGAVKAQFRGR